MRDGNRPRSRSEAAQAGARPVLGLPAIGLPAAGARLWSGLSSMLAREAAAFDIALLLPVAAGLGILAYFAAPDEPGWQAPAIGTALLVGLAVRARNRYRAVVVLTCLIAVGVGFLAAKIRTASRDAPILQRPLAGLVTGLVVGVDPRANGGARLLLRPITIEGVAATRLPAAIRVTVRSADGLSPGDTVTAKALLRPPSLPVLPGAYDFARDAYFDRIGAVGFVAGTVAQGEPSAVMSLAERALVALDRMRNALTLRIAAAIPGENGAIAASQVTGKRGLIPQDANDALRAAGLYHVVSISGLHMALFAGGLFWLIRAALALSSRLVLTRPLKSIAALISLAPAAAYTLFSGAEIATVRSFVMTAMVLMAVALQRTAITRRNLALSACLVLVTTPEQLLGPSFQMSFAAVGMLVAWYDRPRAPGPRPSGLIEERVTRWLRIVVGGLVVTTLVASLATAPFAAFHFHRLTAQSLAANVMATPVVSGLIMPLALAAMVAEPFGYGPPVWSAMGVAVGWFMDIARLVASWPGSDLVVPQLPASALACFGGAIVMLAVLRTRLAFAAALPLLGGLALAASAERPVAIVGAGGHAALARDRAGIAIIAGAADMFSAKEWLLAMADGRRLGDPSLRKALACDAEGCAAPLGDGQVLMLDSTINAIAEDCGKVAILVSPLVVPATCRENGLVLDRDVVRAAGSIAIYSEDSAGKSRPAWRLVYARDPGTHRPWLPVPDAPPKGLAAAPDPAPASAAPDDDAQ